MTTEASLVLKVDSSQAAAATKSLDDLSKSSADADQKSKTLTVSTDALASAAKALAASYVAVKVSDYVKDSALLQARYETLGVSMNVVGNNAGYTSKEMEAAALGMQKTGISMLESRQQALRLVQAHIDLAESSKLARIAQDAAVIGNMNSSEAFATMIHGIQSGQTDVLRNIGLNVSMERSYADMAKTLGVSASELTANQKTQAVLNSVMQEGSAIAGTYEAAMGTAGKQLNSLARYQENYKVVLGETFNEALTMSVMAFTEHLKDANGQVSELSQNNQLKEWGKDITDTLAFVADVAYSGVTFIQMIGKALGATAAQANALLHGNMALYKQIGEEFDKDNDAYINGTHKFRDALEETRQAQADTAAIREHTQKLKDEEAATHKVTEAQVLSAKQLKENAKNELEIAAATEKTLTALAFEQAQITMNARERAILNATTKAMNDDIAPENIKLIQQQTASLYDNTAAVKADADASKDRAERENAYAVAITEEQKKSAAATQHANEEAASKSDAAWSKFQGSLSHSFEKIIMDGGSVFDQISKMFETMLAKMAADYLASGLVDFLKSSFGGGGSGGFSIGSSGGGSSVVSSIVNAGISKVAGNVVSAGASAMGIGAASGEAAYSAGLIANASPTALASMGITSGAAGGGGIMATISGGATAAGSAVMSAISAIPGWGWALGGLALAAKLMDKGGTPTANAGMLLHSVPGADAKDTFSLGSFDSGLNPVGYAKGASQQDAMNVAAGFKTVDSAFTGLMGKAGIRYSANPYNMYGYGIEATGDGVYYGQAEDGETSHGTPIDQQLTKFLSQEIMDAQKQGLLDAATASALLAAGNYKSMLDMGGKMVGIDGSHASGLDYVPFDGYRAELHRGERVQTAAEAQSSRSSDSSMAAVLNMIAAQMSKIADATRSTNNILIRVTRDGDSLLTTAA